MVDSRSNSDASDLKAPRLSVQRLLTVVQIRDVKARIRAGRLIQQRNQCAGDLCWEESRGLSVGPELGAN